MPIFSVIIPLYNKQNDIANTLLSVTQQSFVDFEIIIINDGSTDDSAAEVAKVDDPRIKYYKTVNQGISQARNEGINKATGTLIAFLDADDYWYSNHLERLYLLYTAFPSSGIFATNYTFYYSPNQIITPHYEGIPAHPWQGIVADFFLSSLDYRLAWTSALAIPKKVLDTVGTFDASISFGAAGEDTDLWTRIALQYPVAFDTEVTARYQLNGSNRVSNVNTSKRSFDTLDKFLVQEQENLSLKKFLDRYRAEFALKHKLDYNIERFNFYKNGISKNNISRKTWFLLRLPTPLLRALYNFKQWLTDKGLTVNIYN
ncbi:glycosyltransferase family 2 protein [Flavobacterium sp. '19STA2R22 D10 B1']|uniref:glycosyltransferase family 2 protein n=1 Tax=Flavobacterium aerium TaxID=3037261 RepID=UPI00278C1057|nr:glycosyltransferase family 2 protein [Flavobacterium sp. '19STA2R22 D10 B1']